MLRLMDHNAIEIVTQSFLLSSAKILAVGYQVIEFVDMPYTLPLDTPMTDFRIFTPQQIKILKPVDSSTLTFIMHQHMENADISPSDESQPITS